MIEKIDFKKMQSPLVSIVAVILTSAALLPVIAGNMMYAEAAPAVEVCAFGTDTTIVVPFLVDNGEKCTVDGYTLTNTAQFVIEGSGTLKISDTGIFDNSGTSASLLNYGNIKNQGTLYNGGGGALIVNQGTGTIQNEGAIWNGFITTSGDAIQNFGTIKNKGIIYNGFAGNAIFNFGPGIILNTGTIDNDSLFVNYGLIKSRGIIENDGGGNFFNEASGVIENGGTIENDEFANLFNAGTINNEGTIENEGGIVNNGTINNQGSIINCGTIIGTGTINGNPVEADCTG